MAVKPEIIKARLKVLFPKANLSQKRIDAIAAKLAPMPADEADDAAVDAVLNQANDFNSFEDIAREDDRVRTLEAKANLNTPPDPAKSQDPVPATSSKTENEEAPTWAKDMIETNKRLSQEIEAIKTGKIIDTKKQTAQSVFESSQILKGLKPEIRGSWLNRIDVNSETSIEDQVKLLENEFSDIRQSIADATHYSGPTPPGFNPSKPDDKMIESIVDGIV